MIIFTVIGIYNMDPRSAHLNTESIVVVPSTEIAQRVKSIFLLEMEPQNAWQITKEFNPDSNASLLKQIGVKLRYIIPKKVL